MVTKNYTACADYHTADFSAPSISENPNRAGYVLPTRLGSATG